MRKSTGGSDLIAMMDLSLQFPAWTLMSIEHIPKQVKTLPT